MALSLFYLFLSPNGKWNHAFLFLFHFVQGFCSHEIYYPNYPTLTVYLAIIFFNAIIFFVVFKESSLHEPMYILISCLSVNDLCGSASFFPRLMVDLLLDTNMISRPACFVQIFMIYFYAMSEYTILTLMAYDRYVAIRNPLKYHKIMTSKVTTLYMALASLYAVFSMGLVILFSARLPLCGTEIARLYCSNWSVVRLSCGTSTLSNNITLDFFVTTTTFFSPCLLHFLYLCQNFDHLSKKLQRI